MVRSKKEVRAIRALQAHIDDKIKTLDEKGNGSGLPRGFFNEDSISQILPPKNGAVV